MNRVRKQKENCHAWIEVFTRLGKEGVPALDHLEQITTPDVSFRNPFNLETASTAVSRFNDIVGRRALRALLEHTRRLVQHLRFEVIDTAVSGQRVYLKWHMIGNLRVIGLWRLRDMSECAFDGEGKRKLHRDYWAASEQFYSRLPFIGWMLRRIRSLASAS